LRYSYTKWTLSVVNPNTYLTKIADCALTNMSVDYGANSTLTTVKGTSGAPTEIKMTLSFQELKLLD